MEENDFTIYKMNYQLALQEWDDLDYNLAIAKAQVVELEAAVSVALAKKDAAWVEYRGARIAQQFEKESAAEEEERDNFIKKYPDASVLRTVPND